MPFAPPTCYSFLAFYSSLYHATKRNLEFGFGGKYRQPVIKDDEQPPHGGFFLNLRHHCSSIAVYIHLYYSLLLYLGFFRRDTILSSDDIINYC